MESTKPKAQEEIQEVQQNKVENISYSIKENAIELSVSNVKIYQVNQNPQCVELIDHLENMRKQICDKKKEINRANVKVEFLKKQL